MSRILDRLSQLQKKVEKLDVSSIKNFSFKLEGENRPSKKWLIVGLGSLILVLSIWAGYRKYQRYEALKAKEAQPVKSQAQLDNESLNQLANQLKKNQYEAVESTITALEPRLKNQISFILNKATWLAQKGEVENAIALLIEAKGDHGDNYVLHNNLAHYYVIQGLLDEAEKSYLRALELNQQDAELILNLALLYESKMMWQGAQSYFESYLGQKNTDKKLALKIKKRLFDLQALKNYKYSKEDRYEFTF